MRSNDSIRLVLADEHAIARFWSKVAKGDGCWLWTAGKGARDYGLFGVPCWWGPRRAAVRAHRLSWAITHGRVPPSDMCICHRCDNPTCVRPDHLFLGTLKDNVQDCERKGRGNHAKGERQHCAKLTEADVREIRGPLRHISTPKLAVRYGVHHSRISAARAGRTWKHVV